MAANPKTLTEVKADTLRQAADEIETDYAAAWGGGRMWMTTGTKVANLVAGVLREMASEVES